MIEVRPPQLNELEAVIKFLNQETRQQSHWSIAEEYPLAFSKSNLQNIRIAVDESGKILSHAVIKTLFIKTPLAVYKVAGLGNICTDSHFRNQGLSRQVIENCLRTIKEQKYDFSILWTNLFDFYKKFHFELSGTEVSIEIDDTIAPIDESMFKNHKILDTLNISAEALLRVFNKHTTTSHRSIEDIQKFLKIPQTHAYTLWSESNQLKAYCIMGRGADLTNYIHEWGGDVFDIIYLSQKIYQRQQSPLRLITPLHSQNLITKLKNLGAKIHYGYLGMIKITNAESLLKKAVAYAHTRGYDHFQMNQTPEGILVGRPGKEQLLEKEETLTQLLFGPLLPAEVFPFSKENLDIIEKLFPLPLWVWGWDSI